jgi:hypothetical protein
MRILFVALAILACTGCEEKSDNADGSSQGIDIHCGAALPTGSTTVKVDCPPQ